MTAPKIDTQAPERIWADQDELTWVEADPDEYMRSWETAYIRADLSAAREAAAAQAMREAAVAICRKEQERREWQHKDQHAEDGGWQKERFRVGAQQSRQLAEKIVALPLPDTTALDRLIAERVRVAVEAEREACAQIAKAEEQRLHSAMEKAIMSDSILRLSGQADVAESIAAQIAARGSKEGRDG